MRSQRFRIQKYSLHFRGQRRSATEQLISATRQELALLLDGEREPERAPKQKRRRMGVTA